MFPLHPKPIVKLLPLHTMLFPLHPQESPNRSNGLNVLNTRPPNPPWTLSVQRRLPTKLRTSMTFSALTLAMADALELQEFELALQLKVRHPRYLGCDGVTRYFLSRPPPQEGAGADERQSTPNSPVRIACVPESPLFYWNLVLIVVTGSWERLEAVRQP